VFANGDVWLVEPSGGSEVISDSIIICDGSIRADAVADSILIATGAINIPGEHDSSILIQNSRHALGLLKQFDTRQEGVEVVAHKGELAVKNVLAGKPFARAGLRVDDRVTAIDGTALTSAEQFRRAVRQAAAANREVVLTAQRGKRTLRLTVGFPD
jgi:S1-C subfamily serine protease